MKLSDEKINYALRLSRMNQFNESVYKDKISRLLRQQVKRRKILVNHLFIIDTFMKKGKSNFRKEILLEINEFINF